MQLADKSGCKVDWTDVREDWKCLYLIKDTGILRVMRHLVKKKLKLFAGSLAAKQKELHKYLS